MNKVLVNLAFLLAALLKELERDLAAARTEAAKRQAVRDQAMVILFLNTGLRVSELCDLELDDITLSERKGEIRVLGKGEKARTIPLNNAARSVLGGWLDLRPETEDQRQEVFFVGKKGEPMMPSGVHRRLSELERRAGVDLSAHTLRHTFAKNLVDAGVTLEKVASLVGHSSLDTTRHAPTQVHSSNCGRWDSRPPHRQFRTGHETFASSGSSD